MIHIEIVIFLYCLTFFTFNVYWETVNEKIFPYGFIILECLHCNRNGRQTLRVHINLHYFGRFLKAKERKIAKHENNGRVMILSATRLSMKQKHHESNNKGCFLSAT